MFSYELKRGTLTVYLSGELDQRMAAPIRSEIDALLDDAHIRRLIFDLRDLEFMDSSGIGLIIGRYKRMLRRGGSVAVTELDERIDKIFRMSGLYQLVERLA